jgi:hypothetical protein
VGYSGRSAQELMRDLSELNLNERGKPVKRAAPTDEVIASFEGKFGVVLPEEYLRVLSFANGGHPELDSIQPIGRQEASRWTVNRFYHLDQDKISANSLWLVTERWRPILGQNAIPFACDGGGNQFFLDFTSSPPMVRLCVHDENFSIVDIAPSFGSFIDALAADPEFV